MPLRAERLGLATEPIDTSRKGLWDPTLSHSGADIDGFDDPNLVSSAGLVPMPASADRAGPRKVPDDRPLVPFAPTRRLRNPGPGFGWLVWLRRRWLVEGLWVFGSVTGSAGWQRAPGLW